MKNETLDADEKWMILEALKCLHHLENLEEIKIELKKNNRILVDLLEVLFELKQRLNRQ